MHCYSPIIPLKFITFYFNHASYTGICHGLSWEKFFVVCVTVIHQPYQKLTTVGSIICAKKIDSCSVSLFHVVRKSQVEQYQSKKLMCLDSSFSNPFFLKVLFIKVFFSLLYFTLNSADYSPMNHRKGRDSLVIVENKRTRRREK